MGKKSIWLIDETERSYPDASGSERGKDGPLLKSQSIRGALRGKEKREGQEKFGARES